MGSFRAENTYGTQRRRYESWLCAAELHGLHAFGELWVVDGASEKSTEKTRQPCNPATAPWFVEGG